MTVLKRLKGFAHRAIRRAGILLQEALTSTRQLDLDRNELLASLAIVEAELQILGSSDEGGAGELNRVRDQVELLVRELLPERERHAAEDATSPSDPSSASFLFHARSFKRRRKLAWDRRVGWREDIYDLSHKLKASDFAASHGVRTPRVLGRWMSPSDIPWSELPEKFVLKNSFGGGAVNTFPVFRSPGGYSDQLTDTILTEADMTARLVAKARPDSVFFAEEFLESLPGSARSVPEDLKVFCFYGEVGLLEVRTDDWTRQAGVKQRNRIFDDKGNELLGVRPFIDDDPTLPRPRNLDALYSDTALLSESIKRPYERIDMYETANGIVFGEMTPDSGKVPMLVPEWDARLGMRFEKAYARVLSDALALATHKDVRAE